MLVGLISFVKQKYGFLANISKLLWKNLWIKYGYFGEIFEL